MIAACLGEWRSPFWGGKEERGTFNLGVPIGLFWIFILSFFKFHVFRSAVTEMGWLAFVYWAFLNFDEESVGVLRNNPHLKWVLKAVASQISSTLSPTSFKSSAI